MAITLKQLIEACPFKEEKKKALLERLDTFSEDEKLRLSSACWFTLTKLFQNEMNRQRLNALEEMAKKGKRFAPADFAEIKAKLYIDFAKKLESAKTEAEIEEVREKIEEHLPKREQPSA